MRKGQFKKGISGNPHGRPIGATAKLPRSIKEKITGFLDEKIDLLPGLWGELSARDRAQLIVNLIPYVEAKLQAVALSGEINFTAYSEEQLDKVAIKLHQLTIQDGKNKK